MLRSPLAGCETQSQVRAVVGTTCSARWRGSIWEQPKTAEQLTGVPHLWQNVHHHRILAATHRQKACLTRRDRHWRENVSKQQCATRLAENRMDSTQGCPALGHCLEVMSWITTVVPVRCNRTFSEAWYILIVWGMIYTNSMYGGGAPHFSEAPHLRRRDLYSQCHPNPGFEKINDWSTWWTTPWPINR